MQSEIELGNIGEAPPADARPALDPKSLSHIIGKIYDCALAPHEWEATIGEIAHQFGFFSGLLAVLRFRDYTQEFKVHFNFDDEWKAVEAATFRSVLDGMAFAVVLVDDDLRIVHANPSAEEMLASGDLLQSAHGRLSVRGRFADDALRAAVGAAAEDEARMGQRGIGIPAQASSGAAALVHVMPLARRDLRPGLEQRAVAAVFAVPGGGPHPPVDAIAALYDFTPAESQIFALLCRGTSLEKTAEALGIAKSTARTHLLRVFAKTGCHRQAELVSLAARLSLKL